MFVTVISVMLAFLGAEPDPKVEAVGSEFRDIRVIAEEKERTAILEVQLENASNKRLDRVLSIQQDALFQLPIATVNGQVITGADVLGRYSTVLKHVLESSHPEGYPQMVRTLIDRDLQRLISQSLQEQAFLGRLTKEQRTEWEASVESLFSSEVVKLQRELRVESESELVATLLERGTSLNQVRLSYRRERAAMEHTATLLKPIENESDDDRKKRLRQETDQLISQADVRTAFNWKPIGDNRDGTPPKPVTK